MKVSWLCAEGQTRPQISFTPAPIPPSSLPPLRQKFSGSPTDPERLLRAMSPRKQMIQEGGPGR